MNHLDHHTKMRGQTLEWGNANSIQILGGGISSSSESKSYEENDWHPGVLRKFKQIKSIAICYCREIVETGQDMED